MVAQQAGVSESLVSQIERNHVSPAIDTLLALADVLDINLEYLFEEPTNLNAESLPDYASLDFLSNGSHIYGEIMWPHNLKEKRHPCVIMLHGFPGSARNDDISHALCRIGCVVIVPHHRGAWGSQ